MSTVEKVVKGNAPTVKKRKRGLASLLLSFGQKPASQDVLLLNAEPSDSLRSPSRSAVRYAHGVAFGSMVFGTVLVLGTLILINDSKKHVEAVKNGQGVNIKIERQKPKAKQEVKRQKPKPKPKRARSAPPAPVLGLNSQLSGLDLGLPDFSMDGLNGLDGDLLGSGAGVVMTDDTVDQAVKAVVQTPMMYPPRARAKGIEGYVVFSLLIGITGEIEQIKIIESQPEGVFDEVATQGVNAWKFEPAQYQGQSVKSWAKQRIRFDLS